ncbi:MAG: helix-turn-helix transcriptional regulator [Clostridiales bacterium]|nr:helix-turn-helix transcriptional regulator [Clostridiales bacterium]
MSDQVMQIATRIKALRELSDYTVEEAANELGVRVDEYYSYENGSNDIPISFLLKFAALFGVDTTTVLTGEAPRLSVCALTRKNMGVDINRAQHYTYKNLAYNFNHRKVEPLMVTVVPGANSNMETNSHSGHEFNYVLEGKLRLQVGSQIMELSEGDSAYYDSMHPHAMQAIGDTPCRFIAIVIP